VGGADVQRSEMHDAGIQRDPAKDASELASAGLERRKSRRDTKRKSSRDSKKLQKGPERRRTYSFSPGRDDSIRVPHDENRPPIPHVSSNWKGKGRSNTQGPDPAQPTRPLRASTQPITNTQQWQRMPTLHKRSAQELPRRKSSKKRKEDHDRELEIKAMVAFLPTHPSMDVKSTGKLRKRESKMRAGLSRSPENPSSDVSLPLAESLRSSRSGNSGNETSFKVKAIDILTPRPTIRYSEAPRYAPGASGFISERSESRMRRISERVPVPEEAMKASRRIDELADDLSAGELRELMERDAKRKEKKKIAERIKQEQRIARRQEKQKVDEATAIRDGTPSPVNLERGVMGREVIGLGIGTSAIVTSSKRKNSTESNSGRSKRPTDIFRQETPRDGPIDAQNKFATFHRTASLATENMTTASERSDPIIDVAQVGTVSKAHVSPSVGHLPPRHASASISHTMGRGKREASTSQPIGAPITTQSAPPRRPSETSTRAPQSWTSIFRLRSRNKSSGHASTPSSFSNTSRDSMHANPALQIGYQPMRSSSNIPRRTMSKFREDLPELPLSPPESRVQSPEADVVPPIRTDYPEKKSGNWPSDDPRVRYDTPTSGYRSVDAVRLRDETPTSGHRSGRPSPEPVTVLSQSLASIDSEGSWLSGRKISKIVSNPVPQHHFHDSSSSLSKKYKDLSESTEELGIAEDEYFSRLTPGPEAEFKIHRLSTGNPMPSSDEEDNGSLASPVASEKSKWGAVARHATIVHREPRAKSREGLLNDFEDDAQSEVAGDASDEKREEYYLSNDTSNQLGIQRATSINLGKDNARNISPGSAQLLDLKPRVSGDSKRVSLN
jgi:hypothetical protein